MNMDMIVREKEALKMTPRMPGCIMGKKYTDIGKSRGGNMERLEGGKSSVLLLTLKFKMLSKF